MNYSPLPWGEGGGGGGHGCVRKRGIKEPTRRGPPRPRPSVFYSTATTTLQDGRRGTRELPHPAILLHSTFYK